MKQTLVLDPQCLALQTMKFWANLACVTYISTARLRTDRGDYRILRSVIYRLVIVTLDTILECIR